MSKKQEDPMSFNRMYPTAFVVALITIAIITLCLYLHGAGQPQ